MNPVSRRRASLWTGIIAVLALSSLVAGCAPSESTPGGASQIAASVSPIPASVSPIPVSVSPSPASVSPSPASVSPTASAAPSVRPTASASPTPGQPSVAADARPPAPDGLELLVERGVPGAGDTLATRYTVSWTVPLASGTTVRVFGITACPNEPVAGGVPCVTRSTPLPARIRNRLASGPAAAGSVSWTWPEADVDGPVLAWDGTNEYFAFVARAVNAAGSSRFVVVQSATACRPADCMS